MRRKKQILETIESLTAFGRELIVQIQSADVALVRSAVNAYMKFAREARLAYELLSISSRCRMGVSDNVQSVNSCQSRLIGRLHRFRVASTKYPPHYPDWHRDLNARLLIGEYTLMKNSMGTLQR